jgi:glycosyltransferase involved in cell wall biosynthesis
MKKPRVAIILTHRIQYFINLFDELHRRNNLELLVIYAHETKVVQDNGFGRKISWDNRAHTSFNQVVLPDSATRPHGPFLNSRSRHLAHTLAEFQPDLLYLNGYMNAIQLQAWWWALRHQVPYLLRCDGDNIGRRSAWKAAVRRKLVFPFTRGACKVTHQGAQNKAFWAANGATEAQLVWVPCVSDSQIFRVQAFVSAAARQEFRTQYNTGPGDLALVISGKLESRKRPQDAIRALALCKDLPVRLWILGSGVLEEELKNLARELGVNDKITWLGFKNQSQIPAILQAADILLHTSQADPWPYAILDGAISGLALLLSDHTGSHPDWMAKPAAGMVFGVGKPDEIAGCLKTFVTQPKLLKACQQAAVTRAADYTETNFCDIFEGLVTACRRP